MWNHTLKRQFSTLHLHFYVSLSLRAGEENPASLAESCFRELLGRAAYGNMNNAVHPVLV